MKIVVILAVVVVAAGCTNRAAPTEHRTPAAPNFVVVKTDWEQDGSLVSQSSRGPVTLVTYAAHGIFRNRGASGSMVVVFSDLNGRTCSTIVNAQVGLLAEGSCHMGIAFGDDFLDRPPTAKVAYRVIPATRDESSMARSRQQQWAG